MKKRQTKIEEYFNDKKVQELLLDIMKEEILSRPLKDQEQFFERLVGSMKDK